MTGINDGISVQQIEAGIDLGKQARAEEVRRFGNLLTGWVRGRLVGAGAAGGQSTTART